MDIFLQEIQANHDKFKQQILRSILEFEERAREEIAASQLLIFEAIFDRMFVERMSNYWRRGCMQHVSRRFAAQQNDAA